MNNYNTFRKPTDDELAGRWRQQFPLTAFGQGSFRRYAAGYWTTVSEAQIRKEIVAILEDAKGEGIRPTKGLLSSVLEFCKVGATVDDSRWDANPDVFVFTNGTLELPSSTLRDHSPEDYMTSGAVFPYDPTAKAPALEQALGRLPDDVQAFIQEFFGYALTPDTKYEIALWFVGPPGCGKSTLIAALETVAGSRCMNLGLADLERSRFALGNILGKTAAIATEQPIVSITATDRLNALISGEMLTIEHKFRDPFDISSRIKVLWSMNEKPRVSGGGNGVFRRIKVIEFPALPAGQGDPCLKDKIRNEGPGIFNWVAEGLRRLNARGKFDIPPSVVDASAEYQQSNDTPAIFLEECYLRDEIAEEQSSKLYEKYTRWCDENGEKPLSHTRLADDWKRLGLTRRVKEGRKFWRGIRPKPFPDEG